MLRTTHQESKDMVVFYEDGDLVGAIDYSNKSQHFIDDAINNWENGIMTIETIEKYSVKNHEDAL